MYLTIIFITLIFCVIFFNAINNKKISYFSIFFLLISISYYICYITKSKLYIILFELTNNINIYFKIFCILTLVISLLEYFASYKAKIKQEEVTEELKSKLENIHEEYSSNINEIQIYIELFDEPIGCLLNDSFIINNKLKKIIKEESNIIKCNDFFEYINQKDMLKLFEKDKTNNFRFTVSNENWFEMINVTVNNYDYKLIREAKNTKTHQRANLKTYKQLNNDAKYYYKENKDFYLIFISISNIKEIIDDYGKDFSEIVISRYLFDIYNIPFIFQCKIYYISKTKYVILLEDRLEYNSLLSELEDDVSVITKDDISIGDITVILKSKVGIIPSNLVDDAYTAINKGYDMMMLASNDDYPNDFVIYHEIDEDIDFNYDNIDFDLDLNKYKQRLQ